jgi:hypothetical protein
VVFERGEDVAALEVVAGVSERSAGGRRRGELGLADLGGQVFPPDLLGGAEDNQPLDQVLQLSSRTLPGQR